MDGPYIVEWLDSTATADWMHPRDVDKEMPLQLIRTVGWIVEEDTDRLIICASRRHDDEQIGEIVTIPIPCIRGRERLSPGTEGDRP